MLKSVHIIKYRSCRDLHLSDISNLLVLVGRNGAGKSNIMKAIDWVAKTISNAPEIGSNSNYLITKDGEVSVDFELDGQSFRYYLKHETNTVGSSEVGSDIETIYVEKLSVKEGIEYKDILTRDGELIELTEEKSKLNISNNISSIFAVQTLLPEENSYRKLLDKISTFFGSVNYYPLATGEVGQLSTEDSINDVIINHTDFQKWLTGKGSRINSTQALIHKLLHLSFTDENRYKELLSLIGENGLGLIKNIAIHRIGVPSPSSEVSESDKGGYYFLFFTPCGHPDSKSFRFYDLSYGTRRILHFIISLLYDSASVGLIEQIEDGIHEGLVDKLIPLIRDYSQEAQYIIASHSTAVFNRLTPKEVRVIELNNGTTFARALDEQELMAAKMYMKEDGPLSDFLESLI